MLQRVDQPADAGIHRRLDAAGQPAENEERQERPFRLLGEMPDEAVGLVRQRIEMAGPVEPGILAALAVVLERVENVLEALEQAIHLYSAAFRSMRSPVPASSPSQGRKPPAWRAQRLA